MSEKQPVRFSTGDAGLDRILQGGLLRNGMHVIGGLPGMGKTVLSQQIGFHLASKGHQVVTMIALAESHERMLGHLEQFSFFDHKLVGDKAYYLSASRLFIEHGLLPSLHELRQQLSSPRAEILIFEGLNAVASLASSEIEFRRFLFELNTHLMMMGCTGIFIVDQDEHRMSHAPEFALADTVLLLSRRKQSHRYLRMLEVHKARGTDALLGQHSFTITTKGITVYPRFEAVEGQSQPDAQESQHVPFGVEGLDLLLSGGLMSGSTTLLSGSPGTGKTLLGLQFALEGAKQGEKTLIWSAQEAGSVLARKASNVGLELEQHLASGQVQILWRPPLELLVDHELYTILEVVDREQIKRVVIDSFDEMMFQAQQHDRAFMVVAALSNALRQRGVTTIITSESALSINDLDMRPSISAAADNILHLRTVERDNRLSRELLIVKKREGQHDPAVREVVVEEGGISLLPTSDPADAIPPESNLGL